MESLQQAKQVQVSFTCITSLNRGKTSVGNLPFPFYKGKKAQV